MQIRADMRREQPEFNIRVCIIADVIELPKKEYRELCENLMKEQQYFADRAGMPLTIDGFPCTVLVLGEGCNDGILVETKGESYAYRSAYIPKARMILDSHIRQLADYIVSEGTEHTEDGKWSNTYDELYYHFGAEITDTNGNGKLLQEELKRRDEVNELIMTEDCIEVSYHLEYCENCQENPLSAFDVLGCNIYDEHESGHPEESGGEPQEQDAPQISM